MNSISHFCAYLLIRVPELLPDHTIVSESIFDGTVSDARRILGDRDSPQGVLAKLMGIKGETKGMQGNEVKNIVEKGAILGRALLTDQEMDMEAR